MEHQNSNLIDYANSVLADRDNIKVWSVIVSIFGDLAQNPGDEISGLQLTAIIERIGIRPQAMRVALHRLRKDNWIEIRKAGRVSHYRLSKMGLRESKSVSPRIYDAPTTHKPVRQENWHLILLAPDGLPARIGINQFEIRQGVILGHGPADNVPDNAFSVCFTELKTPNWIQGIILPDSLAQSYEMFLTVLLKIRRDLSVPISLNDVDILVLRVLIIHTWRRLLLRHSEAVDIFFAHNWTGQKCRSLVYSILEDLPRLAQNDAGHLKTA